jgi:hypothetical protein
MKIFDLVDAEGRVFAFEVPNGLLSRRGLARVVGTIAGVRVLQAPRLFSWSQEESFCEFEVDGQPFEAWEPFGDNSRYWIGPKPAQWCTQVELVRAAFEQH